MRRLSSFIDCKYTCILTTDDRVELAHLVS
jgi:hypothetical protein